MANRAGWGISVRMILTTTLLILVTVVGFGVLNSLNINRVYDEATAQQNRLFRQGREQLGQQGTRSLSQAVLPWLMNSNDQEIQPLVKSTVIQDTADRDGKT